MEADSPTSPGPVLSLHEWWATKNRESNTMSCILYSLPARLCWDKDARTLPKSAVTARELHGVQDVPHNRQSRVDTAIVAWATGRDDLWVGTLPTVTDEIPGWMQHFGTFCREIFHFQYYGLRKHRGLLEIFSNYQNKYAVLIAEMKSTHPELHFAGSGWKIHRVVVDKSTFTFFGISLPTKYQVVNVCVLSL